MSDELYFNNELRKCLDAAGLSDCGENDQWNYWYQRVHKAHDQAIDSVTEAQRAENAKLRELCKELLDLCYDAYNQEWGWDDDWALAHERAKKLGVDDGRVRH